MRNKPTLVFILIFFALITGVILLGVVEGGSSSAETETIKLAFDPPTYNFGDVRQEAGTVEHTVTLRNDGATAVTITRLVTSCMCTTARITLQGEQSPSFGMHTTGTRWSGVLAPGAEAAVTIMYDPTVHPDLRGPVTRTIDVYVEGGADAVASMNIRLNQKD